MNLKNPELFRSWLIRQLEPICKANPEPVSKYVCALLKKEKSDGELKQSLISQLEIFLDLATEEFVNFLIDVLENEKYLTDDANFRTADPTQSETIDEIGIDVSNEAEIEPVADEKEQRKSPSPIQAPTPSPPRKPAVQKSFSPRPRRSRFRNERRRVGTRKARRDNSSHSDSPLPERRTVTRKRSASGSSESSTKSPRRSWITSRSSDVKKYKYRNFVRSSPIGQRSRSVSPKMRKRKPANGNFRKRVRANSRSNSDEDRIHKRGPPYANDISARDLPAAKQDLPPIEPPFGQKQRCVDFEGKGYCARGDMCPFDHGPSPIVLDNTLLNGIVPLPPPPTHNTNYQDTNLYTPQYVNPGFAPSQRFRPDNQPSMQSRDLIQVPTIPLPNNPNVIHGGKPNMNHPGKQNMIHAGKPSYGHIFSSLPPGVSQTSVELTNVPAELNNIPDLYENFSPFGNLTLIQAKRNGDATTALLTFTNATEAALAFINVDTTIPNAKAAWYADQCILTPFPRRSIPASGQANAAKSYVLNRRSPVGGSVPPATEATKPTSVVKKPPQQPPLPAAAVANAVKPEPTKTTAPANDDKDKFRQDPGRLLSDLIKKKRLLLEKQLASRKEIIEKMKSLESGGKEEKTWQDVLKKLNDVIVENENSIKISLQQRKEYLQKMNIVPMDSAALNSLKLEQKLQPKVTATAEAHAQPAKPEKTEDAELDGSDQLEENIFEIDVDLSILNQELEEDEDDEQETPPKPSSQTVAAAPVVETVKSDENKSPKSGGTVPEYTRVLVSGFENGDEDELIAHFSQFGAILDKEFDNTIPSATLVYDNRKSAENAKKDGRNFQDRLLSVTVFANKKYHLPRRPPAPPAFKPQYEKEYAPYPSYGANPYKYKNPQMVQSAAARVPANRNVYTYRAEQKSARPANARAPLPLSKPPAENNGVRLTEEEDMFSFLDADTLDAGELESM